MTDSTHETGGAGPSHRSVELAVAALMALFGMIVMYGSLQAGIGWGAEGPKAGFFPFYLGLIIVGGSVVNLINGFNGDRLVRFADWSQLRQVLSVVMPTAIYVILVPRLGIYVSSLLLIAVFMKWLGQYGWGKTVAVACAVPFLTYLMFEKWFLVPLPKGPVEDLLGL